MHSLVFYRVDIILYLISLSCQMVSKLTQHKLSQNISKNRVLLGGGACMRLQPPPPQMVIACATDYYLISILQIYQIHHFVWVLNICHYIPYVIPMDVYILDHHDRGNSRYLDGLF